MLGIHKSFIITQYRVREDRDRDLVYSNMKFYLLIHEILDYCAETI